MAQKVLTKNQIIKEVSAKTNIPAKDIARVFETLNTLALSEVKKNGKFRLLDLGKLVLRQRKARKMMNPFTKKMITVPAKKVVRFSVSKAVKDQLAKK